MNIKLVIRVTSTIMIVIGIAMLTAVPVAYLMHDDPRVANCFIVSSALTILIAWLCRFLSRKANYEFGLREGFGIVTFTWLFAAILGAIPFVLVSHFTWHDAIFESMSGFTTTGASVIGDSLILNTGTKLIGGLKSIPNALIYWRSLTHWIGGMGIVVLTIAILPSLGISAHQLYNAEVPGPTEDKITPRIASSAKILWVVYVLFSVLMVGFLLLGGMSLFESICTSFGTMATGGFATEPASIGQYNSAYLDYVITIFMFLAGTNFILHFKFLTGKPLTHFLDEEFRFYLLVCLTAGVTIAIYLVNRDIVSTSGKVYESVGFLTAFRFAIFQVVSIITTTGFCTSNYNLWPAYCVLIIAVLMFFGGCAGSTSGGMKNSRILLLLKYSVSQVRRRVFVRSLSNVRFNEQRIENSVLHKALAFFFLFIGIIIVISLILCLLGVSDIVTAFTAAAACLANIGPGLGMVGPDSTYAWMTAPAKYILSFTMLLGRLELYTVLVLFLPSFWKK